MRHFKATVIVNQIVDEENVDIDRPRREMLRPLPADCNLHVTNEAFECLRLEVGRQFRRHVIKSRTLDARDGLRLEVCRDGRNHASRSQLLKRLKDVPLPVAEVRAESHVDGAHTKHRPTPNSLGFRSCCARESVVPSNCERRKRVIRARVRSVRVFANRPVRREARDVFDGCG